MESKTKELISALNAENGPVYAVKQELEVIELEAGSIELKKSAFGSYLSIKIGDSVRMVNVKGAASDAVLTNTKFKLELHEAIRELPAAGTRRAISKGTQKVFAIIA